VTALLLTKTLNRRKVFMDKIFIRLVGKLDFDELMALLNDIEKAKEQRGNGRYKPALDLLKEAVNVELEDWNIPF
jgi:hypothetical protein